MILARQDLGDLPEELVLAVVERLLAAPGTLVLQLDELALGDVKGIVDRVPDVGRLEALLQTVRLVADDKIMPPGNAHLDPHDRRNSIAAVPCRLIDADAAGGQTAIEPVELGHTLADLALDRSVRLDVVKGDFEGHLHVASPSA
jgi:hypothetical protein